MDTSKIMKDTIEKAMDTAKNPDFIKRTMETVKNNPEMLEKISKMFKSSKTNPKDEVNDYDSLEKTNYYYNEPAYIHGLTNDKYNGKECIIKSYNEERDRFKVYIEEFDKMILIKNINITKNVS